jgi:hypothetical protein
MLLEQAPWVLQASFSFLRQTTWASRIFFAEEAPLSKRHALNGSLSRLAGFVDFEGFRAELSVLRREKEEGGKDKGGRLPFDVVLMFKVCVLKFLYNLSDDNMEL